MAERGRASLLANRQRTQALTAPAATNDAALPNALALLRAGKTSEAEVAARQDVEQHPTAAAWDTLGIVLNAQGKDAEAARAYREAVRLNPKLLSTRVNLGVVLVKQKAYADARRQFDTVLAHATDPKLRRDVEFNLARLAIEQKQYNEALRYLHNVQRQSGVDDRAVGLSIVDVYLRQSSFGSAQAAADAVVHRHADNPAVRYSLGMLFENAKQWARARQEYEAAAVLVPGNPDVATHLGRVYLMQRDAARAESVLRPAVEHDKTPSADLLFTLGLAYAAEGRSNDAQDALLRARMLAPERNDIGRALGNLLLEGNYRDDALLVLQECVRRDPEDVEAHVLLGEAYIEARRYTDADAEFELVRARQPERARSYLLLALAARKQGNLQALAGAAASALRLDPKSAEAEFDLGFLANAHADPTAAEGHLVRALQLAPDYADALYELGTVYLHQNRYADAERVMSRYVALTGRTQGYYNLYRIHSSLGEKDKAAQDLVAFNRGSAQDRALDYRRGSVFRYQVETAGFDERQRTERDIEYLEMVVQQVPNSIEDLFMLAEAYRRIGQADKAAATVARLEPLIANDERAQVRLAALLADSGDIDEASRHLRAALKLAPRDNTAAYDLALLDSQRGNATGALTAIESLPESQRDSDCWLVMAEAADTLGRPELADQAFRAAITAAPDNPAAYLALARHQLASSDISMARRTLEQGFARLPNAAEIIWGLGAVAALEDHSADAEALFKRAAELNPDWPPPHVALVLVLAGSGKKTEAQQELVAVTRFDSTMGAQLGAWLQQQKSPTAGRASSDNTKVLRRLLLEAARRH